MPNKRVLLAWIGHSDFRALSAESPAALTSWERAREFIRLAVGRAERAAARSVAVLLLGESGTGKELFAQAIHRASPRRDKPWKAINCAAITTTLLESSCCKRS